MTEPILGQIERFAPGFRERILVVGRDRAGGSSRRTTRTTSAATSPAAGSTSASCSPGRRCGSSTRTRRRTRRSSSARRRRRPAAASTACAASTRPSRRCAGSPDHHSGVRSAPADRLGPPRTRRAMETIGVVLSVGTDRVDEFLDGFRTHELPVWQDLSGRGTLVRASISRLDISSRPVADATQFLIVAVFATGEGHHEHDQPPGLRGLERDRRRVPGRRTARVRRRDGPVDRRLRPADARPLRLAQAERNSESCSSAVRRLHSGERWWSWR